MVVAGGTQGGGGGGGSVDASSRSSSSGDGGGGSGGGCASVPGFQPLLPLAVPLSSPPTPSHRPPARLCPPPPRFTGSPSPAAGPDDSTWRGRSLCWFLQAGHSGGVPCRCLSSPVGSPGWRCGCGERRRLCFLSFFFFSPAPPLMLLLSERRNRQWDRSPSSACTSLLGAGSAQLSFENGGSAHR